MGEYGQGKSIALKKIQDEIYIEYNGGLISYSIGGNYDVIESDNHGFRNTLMEDIEALFQNIDSALYTNKDQVKGKYQLESEKTYSAFLDAYDKAFSELNIPVYVVIDELDKIVISGLQEERVRAFLEDLKSVGDNCSRSISLLIAGTPNCVVKMNHLSIDYAQRFEIIENNFLTPEDTANYIVNKCKSKLKYSGYFPFDSQVRKNIFRLTGGNIRRVEAICRQLWNIAANKKQKIDSKKFKRYYKDKLKTVIQNQEPAGTTNSVIEFIADVLIAGGKFPTRIFSKMSVGKAKGIKEFLENDNRFSQVNRSIVMGTEYKQLLTESLIN